MFNSLLLLCGLAGAGWAQSAALSSELYTLINSTQNLTVFSGIVAAYPEVLEAAVKLGNVTVLAPSDEAFEALENDTRGAALETAGEDYYVALLYYHFLNGTYDNITEYEIVPTLLTNSSYTNVTGGQVVGAYFDDDDGAYGFYSGLDIAPEAHGPPLTFPGGVLYVIDQVLNMPVTLSETVVGEETNGTFFAGALNMTGLQRELELLPDTTFFVPVNEGVESVEAILEALSSEELEAILKYHVVPGTVQYYDILEDSTSLKTLQGDNLTVTVTEDESIFINGAALIYSDLIVANGVVHLIDNVLNPNATFTVPANGTDGGAPAWEGAVTTPAPTATGDGSSPSETTGLVSSLASSGVARPMRTAAVGVGMLFGGAAMAINM